MNKARELLAEVAEKMELPADLAAGLPTMELCGFREFSMEPHGGLVEYDRARVSIESTLGRVSVLGEDLIIRRMNRQRITVAGQLRAVELAGDSHG